MRLRVADKMFRRCAVLAMPHGGVEGPSLTSLSDRRVAMVEELDQLGSVCQQGACDTRRSAGTSSSSVGIVVALRCYREP